jgi:peptidyl-prolyl cis-trans isomerase C
MRAMQRPWWAVLGLTLSCLPALAQNAPAPPTPPPQTAPAAAANAVAATVNGQPIFENAVQRGIQHSPAPQPDQKRAQVIQTLIDLALFDQYLTQQHVTVDPKDVDKRIEEMKEELKKNNHEYGKMLEEMKMTEAELRELITAEMRWDKFITERATDKVLQELFDARKYLFDGSTVHVRHILLTPPAGDAKAAEQAVAQLKVIKQEIEKQATEQLAKLPADTDNLTREKKRQGFIEEAFAAQAKEKSACPSGKDRGGDVGIFLGSRLVEPFSRAAFTIKPFEISEPVKTPFGYHLILVTDRKPGTDVKFVKEVKEMVKLYYCNMLHDSIISEAREKSKIVINPAPK